MKNFQIQKMTKKELRRFKNDSFNLLKEKSVSAVELENHLENIARAMSNDIDWLNPESNVDNSSGKDGPYFTDWTKPLPMLGRPNKPKIPFWFFFNNDLEYLQHEHETLKQKYASSLTYEIPVARYEHTSIEEMKASLFSDTIVQYNREVLLGIHH